MRTRQDGGSTRQEEVKATLIWTVADLNGWVTLANGSGTAFRNAKLQLVAGDLNRGRQQIDRMAMEMHAGRDAATANMAEESFSDYRLNMMGRKTTINNNQTKQVSLLEGTDVPVMKRYVVDGQSCYYRNPQHPGAPLKDPADGTTVVKYRVRVTY